MLVVYPKIAVALIHILRPDVLHDRLVGYDSRAGHEEPSGPQVPTPAQLVQVAELLQQLPRRLPLDPLHQVARRDVRRARDEQVDVVDAHVALEDLDLQLRTDRPNDLTEPEADVASLDLLAVLRDPHQVELYVKARVGGPSVVLHPGSLLEVVA